MACLNQKITDRYAVYNGDSCEVLPTLPSASVHLSVHSPPFGGLFQYSSNERDLSNCKSYAEFLDHYEFIVTQEARLLKPGRLACIHCTDVPKHGYLVDLPGDIVRLYEKHGFVFHDRKLIWKEPLRVAIRTRALSLRHSQIVKDATLCSSAGGDFVLAMRKKGANKEPVVHPLGLTEYAGETDPEKRARFCAELPIPEGLIERYKDWKDPKTNKWAHWIWQHYASCIWKDCRPNNVLPYKKARESEEEKHIHPLQLDVIERCIQLWTNPGDTVLTPFMGVGSEVFSAVKLGRRAIGIELKPSYYRQALANLDLVDVPQSNQGALVFEDVDESEELEIAAGM